MNNKHEHLSQKSDKLSNLLRQCNSLPPISERERFWSTFRARASLLSQDRPEQSQAEQNIWSRWRPRLTFSTVAALAMVLFAAYTMVSRRLDRPAPDPARTIVERQPSEVGVPTMTAAFSETVIDSQLSTVEQLEVAVDHDGLLIFHDQENGGTFILLAQL